MNKKIHFIVIVLLLKVFSNCASILPYQERIPKFNLDYEKRTIELDKSDSNLDYFSKDFYNGYVYSQISDNLLKSNLFLKLVDEDGFYRLKAKNAVVGDNLNSSSIYKIRVKYELYSQGKIIYENEFEGQSNYETSSSFMNDVKNRENRELALQESLNKFFSDIVKKGLLK
jgi:hypothetical protein